MNRSRLEPLGVAGTDYEYAESYEQQSNGEPNALDRWLVGYLGSKIDSSKVRLILWDEPLPAPRGLPVTLRFADRGALWMLLRNPPLHFGDLYSAGRISLNGDLGTVVNEAYHYIEDNASWAKWLSRGRIESRNATDSRRNIHHHYDLGNDFYKLWLDKDALQYTCAYYAEPTMTIEQAQQAKMHHVCRKLQLTAGERVVEAGSGWGGFALFMAKNYGVRVRSFNISKEQIAHAREWAAREKLQDSVEFVEDDYRNMTGQYDAFVSIGMLEHVGVANYKKLGELMSRSLSADGRGLIHSIGRDKFERLNPWIDKRIFPGAYPPTLREMMDLCEPNGLSVLDVENIRLHYAETLRAWLNTYEENVDAVRSMFDETFVRAWRFYLAGSMTAFLRGKLQLFQMLFARSKMNKIPWTRAHIYERGD